MSYFKRVSCFILSAAILAVSFALPAFADSTSTVPFQSTIRYFPYVPGYHFEVNLPNSGSNTIGSRYYSFDNLWVTPSSNTNEKVNIYSGNTLESATTTWYSPRLGSTSAYLDTIFSLADNKYTDSSILLAPFQYKYGDSSYNNRFTIDSPVKTGVQTQVTFTVSGTYYYKDQDGKLANRWNSAEIVTNWGYNGVGSISGLSLPQICNAILGYDASHPFVPKRGVFLFTEVKISTDDRIFSGSYNGTNNCIKVTQQLYSRAQGDTRALDQVRLWFMTQGFTYSAPVPVEDADYSSWLTKAVGGFLGFEIFPGFSMAGVLGVIIGFAIFIWFLKVFAGG